MGKRRGHLAHDEEEFVSSDLMNVGSLGGGGAAKGGGNNEIPLVVCGQTAVPIDRRTVLTRGRRVEPPGQAAANGRLGLAPSTEAVKAFKCLKAVKSVAPLCLFHLLVVMCERHFYIVTNYRTRIRLSLCFPRRNEF